MANTATGMVGGGGSSDLTPQPSGPIRIPPSAFANSMARRGQRRGVGGGGGGNTSSSYSRQEGDPNDRLRRKRSFADRIENLIPEKVRSFILGESVGDYADDDSSSSSSVGGGETGHRNQQQRRKQHRERINGEMYHILTVPSTGVEFVVFKDLPQRKGNDALLAACDIDVAQESQMRSKVSTTFFIVLEILGVALTTYWDPTNIGVCSTSKHPERFVTDEFGAPPWLFLFVILSANVSYYLLKRGSRHVPGYLPVDAPICGEATTATSTSSSSSAGGGPTTRREKEEEGHPSMNTAAEAEEHGGDETSNLREDAKLLGDNTTIVIDGPCKVVGPALHSGCLEGLLPQEHRRGLCAVCQTEIPFRGKHCHSCGRCVERFDHHCFWLGTCVGRRNQVMFLILLASMTTGVTWGTIRVGTRLNVCGTLCGSWLSECRLPLAVFVPAFFMSMFCVLLLIGHLGFISTNQTTHEFIKGSRKLPYLGYAAFDRGFLTNWKLFFQQAPVTEELNRKKLPNTWEVTINGSATTVV